MSKNMNTWACTQHSPARVRTIRERLLGLPAKHTRIAKVVVRNGQLENFWLGNMDDLKDGTHDIYVLSSGLKPSEEIKL